MTDDDFAHDIALCILLDMAAEEPPCVREYAVSVFDDVTAPNVVRWPLSCIDHGVVDCPDCGDWQQAQHDRESVIERLVSARDSYRDALRRALAGKGDQ